MGPTPDQDFGLPGGPRSCSCPLGNNGPCPWISCWKHQVATLPKSPRESGSLANEVFRKPADQYGTPRTQFSDDTHQLARSRSHGCHVVVHFLKPGRLARGARDASGEPVEHGFSWGIDHLCDRLDTRFASQKGAHCASRIAGVSAQQGFLT